MIWTILYRFYSNVITPTFDTLAFYRLSSTGELLTDSTGARFPPKSRALNYHNLIFQWEEPGRSEANGVLVRPLFILYSQLYLFTLEC